MNAYAANTAYTPGQNLETIFQVPGFVAVILQSFLVALVGVAVFLVVYGIFKFIVHADDEGERKTGRAMILWGIVGLFLMLSVWGLVNLLANTFNLNTATPPVPQLNAAP